MERPPPGRSADHPEEAMCLGAVQTRGFLAGRGSTKASRAVKNKRAPCRRHGVNSRLAVRLLLYRLYVLYGWGVRVGRKRLHPVKTYLHGRTTSRSSQFGSERRGVEVGPVAQTRAGQSSQLLHARWWGWPRRELLPPGVGVWPMKAAPTVQREEKALGASPPHCGNGSSTKKALLRRDRG